MDQNNPGFTYLKSRFPRISDAKIKKGVLAVPQNDKVNTGRKIWKPNKWSGKEQRGYH